LDPVLAANSGGALADDDLTQGLFRLMPLATIVTPNSVEARRLARTENLDEAVVELAARGTRHLLLKGGHEPGFLLVNRLYRGTDLVAESSTPRLPGDFHGSGCTLAAALATALATGLDIPHAVARAESFVAIALQNADRPRGQGQFLPRRITPR
jgi:hydroxymethylpyrimidine kinase/phosphomethylpyrimidine kinase